MLLVHFLCVKKTHLVYTLPLAINSSFLLEKSLALRHSPNCYLVVVGLSFRTLTAFFLIGLKFFMDCKMVAKRLRLERDKIFLITSVGQFHVCHYVISLVGVTSTVGMVMMRNELLLWMLY